MKLKLREIWTKLIHNSPYIKFAIGLILGGLALDSIMNDNITMYIVYFTLLSLLAINLQKQKSQK